jgi:hypothetical protein
LVRAGKQAAVGEGTTISVGKGTTISVGEAPAGALGTDSDRDTLEDCTLEDADEEDELTGAGPEAEEDEAAGLDDEAADDNSLEAIELLEGITLLDALLLVHLPKPA